MQVIQNDVDKNQMGKTCPQLGIVNKYLTFVREHQQKTFITLSGFWLLSGCGSLM